VDSVRDLKAIESRIAEFLDVDRTKDTRLGTSVGSSVINKEQSAPTRHLRPRTQPISCRDTLFMTIFEVHFELWRATGIHLWTLRARKEYAEARAADR
jgi:hypothetical protein